MILLFSLIFLMMKLRREGIRENESKSQQTEKANSYREN